MTIRFVSFGLIIATTCLLLSGCSSTEDNVKRGSLKEAMEKSSDRYKGDRKVADSRESSGRNCNRLDWDREADRQYHRATDEPSSPSAPPAASHAQAIKSTSEYSGTSVVPASDSGVYVMPAGDSMQANLTQTDYFNDSVSNDFLGKGREGVSHNYLLWNDTIRDAVKQTQPSRKVKKKPDCYIGLRLIGGDSHSPHYSGMYGASMMLLFNSGKSQFILDLGGANMPIDSKSDLYGSAKDLGQIWLGYEFRTYPWAPGRIFLSIGGEANLLAWDYINPIRSDVYDDNGKFVRSDTVKNDMTGSFSGNVGIGISLIKTDGFIMNFECEAGGSAFWGGTSAGFYNDLFKTDLFVKAIFEVGIGMHFPENHYDQ